MRRFVHIILCLVALTACGNAFGQSWYDNAWSSRRAVVINNTARPGDLSDYAVKVVLTTANFDFSAALPNGQDLRFTDAGGIILLPYWIQSYDVNSAKATVWVKVPLIPGSTLYTVYLYYGNPMAQEGGNGSATFPLYSHFDQTFKVIAPALPGNFDRMILSPECPAPLVAPGAAGEYDHWGYREHGNVLVDSTETDTTRRYKMWFSALHDSVYISDRNTWLGAAFSADGYNWVKQGRVNPWTYGEDPFVVKVGNIYFLYFEDKSDARWDRVGVMTSTDALNWSNQGIAVPPDPTRLWMNTSPSSPTVWVQYGVSDTTWYCYFEGKGTCGNCGGGSIGLATSHDGYNFAVYGQDRIIPLGNPGEWDDGGMVPDAIFKVNGQYWLTYHGLSNTNPTWKNGYAFSTDLIHWTKATNVSGNPNASDSPDPQDFWDRNGALQGTECTTYLPLNRPGILRSYLCRRDTTQWPYRPDWTLVQKGSNYGLGNDSAGTLVLSGEAFYRSSASIVSSQRFTDGFSIEMKTKYLNYGTGPAYCSVAVGSGDLVDMNTGGASQWETTVLQSGYAWFIQNSAFTARMPAAGGKSILDSWTASASQLQNYNVHRFVYDDTDSLKWYVGDTLRARVRDVTFRSANKRVLISQGEYPTGQGGEQFLDWVFVRKCVSREPFTQVAAAETHQFVVVASPNGGEVWGVGQNVNVIWTSGQTVAGPMRIELNRSYPSGSWEVLSSSTPNTGQFALTVGGEATTHCRVRVSTVNDTLSDISDADFSVVPRIAVISPDGGEHWMVGETHPVVWQADGVTGLMRLELCRNYPTPSWSVIADSVPNTGSVTMLVTGPLSDSCRVRVSEIGTSYFAVSDSDFTISGASIYVLSPNGGETWNVDVPTFVRWSSQFVTTPVRIELNRSYPSGSWEVLSSSTPNTGQFALTVGGEATTHCRVRVSTVNDTLSDISDADFSVVPRIAVISPDGGEHWMVGETHPVVWQADGVTGLMRLELGRNYPTPSWSVIADSVPNTGSVMMLVTGPFSDSCRVRVSDIGTNYFAVSDSDFSIIGASFHVLAPDGGETWKVGVPAFVRWSSQFVTTPVRIELNRDYPQGAWEILADSVDNTGQFQVEVSAPISESCRVRVQMVSDTTSDISDGDFHIIPDVHVVSPNGGEQWLIHETDQVQWWAVGWPGLIRIELNRDYPNGVWVIAADSLPNNGQAYVGAGDSLSEDCRVRVSTIGASYSDLSDSNFAITVSEGFLVMVRPSQPGAPVSSWDVGTVECPAVPTDTFLLRNMGDQNVTVYSPPEPASGMFQDRSSCGDYFTLPPGQMSACDMVLSFGLPDLEGTYHDTLLIPTDAANQVGGYVRIPLSGRRVSTPVPPQITISSAGNDIHLDWPAATQSVGGCTLAEVQYHVYSAPTANGPYDLLSTTADTSFVQPGAASQGTPQFYYVTAWTATAMQMAKMPKGSPRVPVREGHTAE